MRAEIKNRVKRLEERTTMAKAWCAPSQVIIYDLATGEPLTRRDPAAIKTIWIPGSDPNWNPR